MPDTPQPPEVRISPDYTLVAIRNRENDSYPWSASNGGWLHDSSVADWLPMMLWNEQRMVEVFNDGREAGLAEAEGAATARAILRSGGSDA